MIGKEIGIYRITEKIGQGGMGVVYKAVDTTLDRVVALKVLNSEVAQKPDLVERFRSEARVQAGLSHPNLTTLYAFLVWEDVPVMVMEFIEGETFHRMIARRRLIPAEECLPLFRQALLGVGAAHRRGIIHRDIKPSNVMLNEQGLVKVMDFGIAKVLGVGGTTRTNMQMGTSWYMSPEQVMSGPVDPRSDIYSLGVMLYEMLTGQVPFRAESDFAVQLAHMEKTPDPPTVHNPQIPQNVAAAAMKALAKRPEDRFASVEEFFVALADSAAIPAASTSAPTVALQRPIPPASEMTLAPEQPTAPATLPPVATTGRFNWKLAGAGAALLAAIAGGVFYSRGAKREQEDHRRMVLQQQEAEKQRQAAIEEQREGGTKAQAETAEGQQTKDQSKKRKRVDAQHATAKATVAAVVPAKPVPPPAQPSVAQATSMPPPASPARTAALQKLTGIWKGSYTCNEEQTTAELQINATPDGISAVMLFDVPGHKPGRYLMEGRFFPLTKVLNLRFVSWAFHPPKHRFVNLSGTVDLQGGTITGRAQSPGCTIFSVRRQ
jgi:Protein kinase domain